MYGQKNTENIQYALINTVNRVQHLLARQSGTLIDGNNQTTANYSSSQPHTPTPASLLVDDYDHSSLS